MNVVVTHRGARDAYQVAAGLAEAGMLHRLVTDLFWPADTAWARGLERWLPASVRQALRRRGEPAVPSRLVELCTGSGVSSLALSKMAAVPFGVQKKAVRWNDNVLGRRAGRIAAAGKAALLSYSYYGYAAFRNLPEDLPRILFQLHPHPSSVRSILRRELELHPGCAASLQKEWELALSDDEFEQLVAETRMAQHWIAASSFTKQTLIENGAPADRIHVTPYGVDSDRFRPPKSRTTGGPLRLLFVGTLNQRKGIRYLLEALRLLNTRQISLTFCGRVVDDLKVFAPWRDQVEIRPNVSAGELVRAYQRANLFVFPSLAEGFGHVLLEAMSCGLPILSTTRTAAVDLVKDSEGFVVEPGDPQALAERIEWALLHRSQLAEMGPAARLRAEQCNWAHFRSLLTRAVRSVLDGIA